MFVALHAADHHASVSPLGDDVIPIDESKLERIAAARFEVAARRGIESTGRVAQIVENDSSFARGIDDEVELVVS